MDGQKEARKTESADVQMEKGEKDKHLKLLTMPRTILCYKHSKTKIIRTLLKRYRK